MTITKYGRGLVFTGWLVFIVFVILSVFTGQFVIMALAVGTGLFSIFNLFFFRDPRRDIPENPDAVLSPADGKVIEIEQEDEQDFFKGKVTRISIFLSVFDVHVNRVPFSGRVEYFRYLRGRFIPAFKEDASWENEQTILGIRDDNDRKVMYKQIAGILARRIACDLREGYMVRAGERMGMIRYGSRVDVFFPQDAVKPGVRKGEKVRGGISILGVFR